MSDVSVWTVFAYKDDAPSHDDHRAKIAEWQLEQTFRWLSGRGYDTILFEREPERVEFRKEPPIPDELLRHHFNA